MANNWKLDSNHYLVNRNRHNDQHSMLTEKLIKSFVRFTKKVDAEKVIYQLQTANIYMQITEKQFFQLISNSCTDEEGFLSNEYDDQNEGIEIGISYSDDKIKRDLCQITFHA